MGAHTESSNTDYTVQIPVAKASSSKVKLDSDEEMDFVPRVGTSKVTKAPVKAKAAPKKAILQSEEDDSDIAVAKPKKAATAKSKTKTLDTDEDDESDLPPPKAKKAAPPKPKKKAEDSDDDDFDMDDS